MKKRLPAKRVYLSEIEESFYVEKEGDFEPNYILTQAGEKIFRVKLVATIVGGPYFSDDNSYGRLLLDDSTSTMWASAFRENVPMLKRLKRGDLIQLIAKPKEWQNTKQLNIEAIAKVEPNFILLSRVETILRILRFRENVKKAHKLIDKTGNFRKALELASKEKIDPEVLEGIDELTYLKEKIMDEKIDLQKQDLVKEKVIGTIKNLQESEDGVEIDVIIAELDPEFTIAEVEEALKSLLSRGVIFEPRIGHYMLA
ncbi:MAG: OB-fold nucleic acid binding domain-containing protein [Candidatus Methanofastidiosia archaeon]